MDEIELDEIGRILSSEKLLEPSPDFVRRVLGAVRREALAPPPIPFPWRRVAAAAVVLALASTAAAAMPAVREPAGRALASLGGIDWPIAGAPMGALALSLLIVSWTLWSVWRAR